MLTALIIVASLLLLMFFLLGFGWYKHQADWGHWLVNCMDGWVRVLCRCLHKLQCENINMPKDSAGIIVANHISGLDPLLLIASVNRPIRFMMAREEYHQFGLHWLFKRAGCIPVDRQGKAEWGLRQAFKKLKQGELVGIFPEGSIQTASNQQTVKSGVVKLAQLSATPIYPFFISGVKGEGLSHSAILMASKAKVQQIGEIDVALTQHDEFLIKLNDLIKGKSSTLEIY